MVETHEGLSKIRDLWNEGASRWKSTEIERDFHMQRGAAGRVELIESLPLDLSNAHLLCKICRVGKLNHKLTCITDLSEV
jgi:hypothetical protein